MPPKKKKDEPTLDTDETKDEFVDMPDEEPVVEAAPKGAIYVIATHDAYEPHQRIRILAGEPTLVMPSNWIKAQIQAGLLKEAD